MSFPFVISLVFVTITMIPSFFQGKLFTCQAQVIFPGNQKDFKNQSTFIHNSNSPMVKLKQGTYIGLTRLSRNLKEYSSFIGLRYAKPIKIFQQWAELPDESESIQNATTFGPLCLQTDWFKTKILGEQDCLFLNVYTKQLNETDKESKKLLPVMMYIHGGAFLFGSGNVYLPDYIMDEDVILITLNYRLGVLGFLSTEDSVIQGNMGLKDQVVALRWLKENIKQFSGDPDRITIFGESAGGASVSYHFISPLSKGLFQQGISHSGTALCAWAFVRKPKRVALKLGKLLNCNISSSQELLKCLRNKDPKEIVYSQEKLTVWNRDPFALFGPSVETLDHSSGNEESQIFLHDTPYKLMCQGQIQKIPWIIGVCKDEGLLFHAAGILHNPILTNDMNLNWTQVAPVTLLYAGTARDPLYVSKKIRKYYFGDDEISLKGIKNLTTLYSDRYFFTCTRESALLHAKVAPVYLYQFSYPGEYSILQAFGLPKYGQAHGDDLQYFFPYSKFPFLELSTEPGQFSKNVVRLWTSFVETGCPWDVWRDEEWRPVSQDEIEGKSPLTWYNLDWNSSTISDPYNNERMRFWENIPLHELKGEI